MKSEQEKESIQAEILILERLDREGIPKIYDIKETGDYFYIIEEYIQGRTLWEIIRSDGPFDLHDAVFYSRQLTEIIIYLHSIKPDAVLRQGGTLRQHGVRTARVPAESGTHPVRR